MIPELEALLRRCTLAQVRSYRAMRVRQGNGVINRAHMAQGEMEQFPDSPQVQERWQIAQAARAQYERGMAELDAMIAEKGAA